MSRIGITRRNLSLCFGLTVLFVIVLIALLAPTIATQNPNIMSLADRFAPPTSQHIFGLDQNGADVFSQVIYGARVSLLVSFVVVLVSSFIGLVIGSIAGYLGGWVDVIVMRFLDMLYAFPGFLLALSLVAVLGPSIKNLILAMCCTSWTAYARLVRGEFLHLKNREYVLGAVAIGAHPFRVAVFHIWPNLFGILIVQMSFGMAGTIIAESGLSYLGLGAPPDVPTWGALLNSGRRALIEAPHLSLFPGLAILILVLGFNLLGDGLRDFFNPKKF